MSPMSSGQSSKAHKKATSELTADTRKANTPTSTCTLKDLQPQDKQKVSNLIKQVVELKQQCARVQQQADEAVNAKERLANSLETNKELASENANLKTKLVNMLTLLRVYQHRVQILDAQLHSQPPTLHPAIGDGQRTPSDPTSLSPSQSISSTPQPNPSIAPPPHTPLPHSTTLPPHTQFPSTPYASTPHTPALPAPPLPPSHLTPQAPITPASTLMDPHQPYPLLLPAAPTPHPSQPPPPHASLPSLSMIHAQLTSSPSFSSVASWQGSAGGGAATGESVFQSAWGGPAPSTSNNPSVSGAPAVPGVPGVLTPQGVLYTASAGTSVGPAVHVGPAVRLPYTSPGQLPGEPAGAVTGTHAGHTLVQNTPSTQAGHATHGNGNLDIPYPPSGPNAEHVPTHPHLSLGHPSSHNPTQSLGSNQPPTSFTFATNPYSTPAPSYAHTQPQFVHVFPHHLQQQQQQQQVQQQLSMLPDTIQQHHQHHQHHLQQQHHHQLSELPHTTQQQPHQNGHHHHHYQDSQPHSHTPQQQPQHKQLQQHQHPDSQRRSPTPQQHHQQQHPHQHEQHQDSQRRSPTPQQHHHHQQHQQHQDSQRHSPTPQQQHHHHQQQQPNKRHHQHPPTPQPFHQHQPHQGLQEAALQLHVAATSGSNHRAYGALSPDSSAVDGGLSEAESVLTSSEPTWRSLPRHPRGSDQQQQTGRQGASQGELLALAHVLDNIARGPGLPGPGPGHEPPLHTKGLGFRGSGQRGPGPGPGHEAPLHTKGLGLRGPGQPGSEPGHGHGHEAPLHSEGSTHSSTRSLPQTLTPSPTNSYTDSPPARLSVRRRSGGRQVGGSSGSHGQGLPVNGPSFKAASRHLHPDTVPDPHVNPYSDLAYSGPPSDQSSPPNVHTSFTHCLTDLVLEVEQLEHQAAFPHRGRTGPPRLHPHAGALGPYSPTTPSPHGVGREGGQAMFGRQGGPDWLSQELYEENDVLDTILQQELGHRQPRYSFMR